MLVLLFSLIFFAAVCGILVMAAWSDWHSLSIPNHLSLALVGIFLLGAILPESAFPGVHFIPGLIGGAVVFFLLMLLYALGAMGGGDTKLAGAMALLAGTSHFSLFLIVMVFSGGVLGLYALFARKYPETLIPKALENNSWLSKLRAGENKIPYALPIALAGIVTTCAKWLIPVFDTVFQG